jgi:hypothetical protein
VGSNPEALRCQLDSVQWELRRIKEWRDRMPLGGVTMEGELNILLREDYLLNKEQEIKELLHGG